MVIVGGDSIASAPAHLRGGLALRQPVGGRLPDPHIDDDDRLKGVEAIRVDEERLLNANPTSRTVYTAQTVDVDRHLVLDVVKGGFRDVLDRSLTERGADWCAQIRLATSDPAAG